MRAILIIILCIVSAICYGIIHDQITARICVEYFTIGHPPIFHTDSPTLQGFGWGVIATWWVGLILGVPLAIAARIGHRPKRSPMSLIRPIAVLLTIMGMCAALAGLLGFILARNVAAILMGPIAGQVPKNRHVAFLIDLWMHNASYLFGFFGGIVLVVKTWRSRGRVSATRPRPRCL